MAIDAAQLLEQLGRLTESRRAAAAPDDDPDADELRLARLQRRLRAAAAVLRRAAELLGACPACLGLEPGCRTCRGRGRPGSAPTEARALAIWLAPIAADLDTPSPHQGEHR